MENPDTTVAEFKGFLCTNCGAGLKYKPGTKTMACDYCSSTNEIHEEETIIEELDFNAYIENFETLNLQTEKIISCKSCGASSSVDENLKSLHCSYCTNPLVEDDISEQRLIKPGYLLPFNIDEKKTIVILEKWKNSLWLTPSDFKKFAPTPIDLRGIYVPYWTFDAKSVSAYTGASGDDYTVTEGSGDDEREVTKTSWTNTFGTVRVDFDDIITPASGNISPEGLAELEPWDFRELVKVNDQYLSGFITEKYTIPLQQGFTDAKTRMENRISKAIREEIGGDRQRIYTCDTQYDDIQFKHIMVPVYVSSYRYKEKIYHFYINGRNGKIYGESPTSLVFQIVCVIVAILIIIAIIVL